LAVTTILAIKIIVVTRGKFNQGQKKHCPWHPLFFETKHGYIFKGEWFLSFVGDSLMGR